MRVFKRKLFVKENSISLSTTFLIPKLRIIHATRCYSATPSEEQTHSIPHDNDDNLLISSERQVRKIKNYWFPKPTFITTTLFPVFSDSMNEHLFNAIAADCIKRYYEMRGRKVLLSVGTAEYGHKVQQAVAESGLTAQEFCEKKMIGYKEVLDAAKVMYTDFIRTTELRHEKAVTYLWNSLVESGLIYKTKQEGWYSSLSQSFYIESKIKKVKHLHTGKEMIMSDVKNAKPELLEWASEEHYNFKLPRMHYKLKKWLDSKKLVFAPDKPENYLYEIKKLLKSLRVSRPRSQVDWEIPVPNDPEHTIEPIFEVYVNYLTVAGYPWSNKSDRNHWPIDINVCNIKSIKTHAETGPALLLAANIMPVKKIFANSFKSYSYNAETMNVIHLYGLDAYRYVYMAYGNNPEPQDFSLESFNIRYHKDLVNQLGKLINNCLKPKFMSSPWTPRYPQYTDDQIVDEDVLLHKTLSTFSDVVEKYYENFDLANALKHIIYVITLANNHFEEILPYEVDLIKDRHIINRALFYSFETLRISGILLMPIMPDKSTKLLNILGVWNNERKWEDAKFGAGWTYVDGKGRKWADYLYQELYPCVNVGLGGSGLNKQESVEERLKLVKGKKIVFGGEKINGKNDIQSETSGTDKEEGKVNQDDRSRFIKPVEKSRYDSFLTLSMQKLRKGDIKKNISKILEINDTTDDLNS
ncbi:4541_t:CDS:10 [Acaulospora morrowiae]|uniref:4541_t:CDS:1 n=1 Tax=Acaulospora morrowiae TaxID=94023 RepID=A0A9N8VL14_9GLOM|nr:4541_t:CDS:10 [Acaulospora morrowiae]